MGHIVNAIHSARRRREILRASEAIPPLPELVVRLLKALGDPETEPEDLESLLETDPVLVGRMLAMVNSPYFGLNRAVTTVREAVMVLGFRGIRTLALATSTCRFLSRDYSCYGFIDQGLWQHSMAVATMARHLGRACGLGVNQAEELFVAGLLHDIGKMLLAQFLEGAGVRVGVHGSADSLELAHAGIDHAEAGALIAAKWNLPAELQDLIAHHHDPAGLSTVAATVLRAANQIAGELGIGLVEEAADQYRRRRAEPEDLPISVDAWTALVDEATALASDAVRAAQTAGNANAQTASRP